MGLSTPQLAVAQNPANDTWLQSFLSSVAGGILTQIGWGGLLFQTNSTAFDLRAWDGTQLIGPSLFYHVETGGHPVFSPYTLNVPNVTLAANAMYAIVIESTGGTLGTITGDQVANGSLFIHAGTSWMDVGTDMAGFTLTYASPPVTATPEPASLALLAAGLVGVGGYARRRRRRE